MSNRQHLHSSCHSRASGHPFPLVKVAAPLMDPRRRGDDVKAGSWDFALINLPLEGGGRPRQGPGGGRAMFSRPGNLMARVFVPCPTPSLSLPLPGGGKEGCAAGVKN